MTSASSSDFLSCVENVREAPSATFAGASNTETWQSLEERYANTHVRARQAQCERSFQKVSKHDKERFWKEQEKLARRTLRSEDREKWLVEIVSETVSGMVAGKLSKDILLCIRSMRRASVAWLKPRAKGLPCVRAWHEAKWSASLSIAEALLGTKVLSARKTECVWTRYLSKALQRMVLLEETWPVDEVRKEVQGIFDTAWIGDENETVAYFIVPRKGTLWYAGITQCIRQWGRENAEDLF